MKKNTLTALIALAVLGGSILPMQNVSAASSQTPILRSQVEQRALNMINLNWTYDSSKNSSMTGPNAAFVTTPKQFANITIAQETGIPYDWGGEDGIDTTSASAPWTGFLDAISKGAYAGNVNTDAGYGYITGTAGLDCSGFVQAAFDIKDYKQSTSTLLNYYFKPINLSDLKHMDILDHPGDHVVIFNKWGTLNGVNGAFTYESTPDQTYGGIQGAKQYFISLDDINKEGYIPARYINIIDDTVPQQVPTTQTNTPTQPVSTTQPPAAQFSTGSLVQVTNVNYAANFRTSGSISAAIIGTVPKGTVLSVLGFNSGWYNVNYNGQSGWIFATLLAAPQGKYVTVNGVYSLNIRNIPSMTSTILGMISQGQYAEVIGTSTDGKWYELNLNGLQGWAYASYLK